MAQQDALQLILLRSAFYRRMHFLALFALSLMISVIVILIILLLFILRNPVSPLYFATDKVGRLIQVVPVTVPNMTTDEVMAWTVNAVEKSFSTNFIQFRDQLQSSQKYFTTYGWSHYMRALNANNNILAIKQLKLIVMAKVLERPKIVIHGILGGAYAWRFQMPVLLTYWLPPYDNTSKRYNTLDVSVIVQRQEVLQSDNGLGIVQIIARLVTEKLQPTSATPGR